MKSMARLILLVAGAVSIALMVGIYLMFNGFGDRMLQQAAFSQSQTVARLTFSSMFQLMSQGWKREQVMAFAANSAKAVENMPLTIEFYRGEPVSRQYGAVPQAEPDAQLANAMRTGRPQEIATEKGVRYLFPLVAEAQCLACHTQAKKGDVLGTITVRTQYDHFIDTSSQHLMLVLLLLAPIPFVAAWVVALLLHNRMENFAEQVDKVITAQAGGTPDFSRVDPYCSELDEILDKFKKLAGKQTPPAG